MSPAAHAANAHLVEVWRRVPIGTRVIVRRDDESRFETVTRSEPWLLGHGAAVIQVKGISGCYALDRVSFAEPVAPATPVVSIADTIQPAPRDEQLAFADRPTAIVTTAILFYLTVGLLFSLKLVLDRPEPLPPPWLCEEMGVGCEWREAAP